MEEINSVEPLRVELLHAAAHGPMSVGQKSPLGPPANLQALNECPGTFRGLQVIGERRTIDFGIHPKSARFQRFSEPRRSGRNERDVFEFRLKLELIQAAAQGFKRLRGRKYHFALRRGREALRDLLHDSEETRAP